MELRPYQKECIDVIQKQPHGSYLVQMAVGLGKTVTFANIPRNGRVLLLSHREELVEQPRKYFDCSFGVERATNHSNGEEVVSASVQTMVRRLDRFFPDEFDMLIVDECFPAGTFVDGKPIETIHVGDVVTAYNHKTGLAEQRHVLHVFKKKIPSRLIRLNKHVACTENHPIYIKGKGYINAKNVLPGDYMLRRVRCDNQVEKYDEISQRPLSQNRKSILLRNLQKRIFTKNQLENYGRDKQKIRLYTNASKKSDGMSRDKKEGIRNSSKKQSQTYNTGGERARTYSPAGNTDRCIDRIAPSCGVRCSNKTSDTLQIGYCNSRKISSHRNRRRKSLFNQSTGGGCEERAVFEFTRVESIEILERGRDEEYEKVCGDGFVYNLEVESLNNYFANDILVHNCHHASANTYRKILSHFKPRLTLGFTATPNRSDKVRLDDIFSKIIFQRDLRWGIENGYLSDIHCLRVDIGYDLTAVRTRMGDYAPGELEEAMEGTADAIAEAYQKYAKGATLIFAVSIKQAHEIASRIPGAEVVTGGTKNRADIIQRFTRGEIPCIVNVMVFAEGTDIPRVETVIVARPTQSESLYCLDENTEVLTENGWKKDVSVGERVAAFDMDTGEILYIPAIAKVRRKLDQDEYFCSIVSPSSDIRVTNKHRMLYDTRSRKGWKIREAEQIADIRDGCYIPVCGSNKFPGVELTDDEIRFISWVMTDGTISKANNAIYISQSSLSPFACEIQRVIESCGMKYGKYICNSKTSFNRCGDNIVWAISKGRPRGRDKHLRGWGYLERYISKDLAPPLMNMDERQFGVMLETIHFADGHKQRSSEWTQRSYHIGKGNKSFIERLQIMAIQRGFRANVSVERAGKVRKSDFYTLHVKKQNFVKIGSCQDTRPRWIKEPHTDEMCWCVQNELGTLVTRRNGKVAIVGNCQMTGRGLRLFPGKQKLTLIDCVGVTGKASLCTAPTLLGIDMSAVPLKRAQDVQGDLFELPQKAIFASDCPESWIRNVQIVDLWAKKQKYVLHDVNWFKLPDGSLTCHLPNRKKITIPCPDVLGMVGGVPMQKALDEAYQRLCSEFADCRQIWDVNAMKRWGGKPATENQLKIIRRKLKNFDVENLTKGEASQILNRLFSK